MMDEQQIAELRGQFEQEEWLRLQAAYDQCRAQRDAAVAALLDCPELGSLEWDCSPGTPEWWVWWDTFRSWYGAERQAALALCGEQGDG